MRAQVKATWEHRVSAVSLINMTPFGDATSEGWAWACGQGSCPQTWDGGPAPCSPNLYPQPHPCGPNGRQLALPGAGSGTWGFLRPSFMVRGHQAGLMRGRKQEERCPELASFLTGPCQPLWPGTDGG